MPSTSSDLPLLIGIDIGTTSLRAVAFDAAGRRVTAASRPTPITRTETGGELDLDGIFDRVIAVLAEVAATLGGRPVAGLSVSSIGESCVLLSSDDRVLAPSILWYDRRTEPVARAFGERVGVERIFAMTGHGAEPIFTLMKLLWMREHWPEAIAGMRKVFLLADWISYRLSGEAAIDPSLASRTLYFDMRRQIWSEAMLDIAGFRSDLTPRVAASGTPLGPLRKEIIAATGLKGTPVVAVGGHDHVVGSFSNGLGRSGVVIDSIGTAEGLIAGADAPIDDIALIERGYVQGAIDCGRPRWYIMASLYSSGGALEWLRALAGDAGFASLTEEAATLEIGSGGVLFLPHLANSPPPEPDANARGAFFGLTPATGRAALYRAVIEGLAMQLRAMLEGLAAIPGIEPPRDLRLIGGPSRNRLLASIKANVFGRPLTIIDEPEVTALGAALLGAVGAGVYRDLDAALAGLQPRSEMIEPHEPAMRRYEDLFGTFKELHAAVMPINRRIAGFIASA